MAIRNQKLQAGLEAEMKLKNTHTHIHTQDLFPEYSEERLPLRDIIWLSP